MEGGGKKVQVCADVLALYPSSSFSWDLPFLYEISIEVAVEVYKELASALASYSQTPGPFAEPLVPSSHIPQIKITYLVFTDLCFGAPPLLGSIKGNH